MSVVPVPKTQRTATDSQQTSDDVDLTVLAATSVLDDLIDKCPPAEACRDAFDRMSKATIKMCTRETGFGSQVKYAKQVDDSPVTQHHFQQQIPPPPKFTSIPSRPPPCFDDNWRDLFPENWLSSDGHESGNPTTHWHVPTQSHPAYTNQRPTFPLSNGSSTSSSLNPNVEPLTSDQQLQQSQQNFDPSRLPQPAISTSDNNAGMLNYDMYDFDFLMNSDNLNTISTFTGDSGLNLGFDGQHNWADGGNQQLPDLFGGFFFGGPAGESAGMDIDAGYPAASDFGDANSSAAGSLWSGGQEH